MRSSPYLWSLGATALGRTGSTRFLPYSYQKAILTDPSPRRLILKARQVGISQAVGIEVRHAAEHDPETTTLFVSRNEKLAAELIRYTRLCARERAVNRILRNNAFSLEFANGSRVIAEPATRSAGRGIAAKRAYLDEFAFVDYDEDIWRSIEPTADRITVLSTPNGYGNLFYLMWAGEYGEWSKHIVGWRDCPRYWTPEERAAGLAPEQGAWYRSKRAGMTLRDWASEYECDFVESGGSIFPADLCERVYDRRLPGADPSTWIVAPATVTYWDLGARQDATVGVTVARVAGKLVIVAFARYGAPNEWPDMAKAISERVTRYPDGRHYVESNGIGDPFISHLREQGLPIEEFLVTPRSKADILRALSLASEQDTFRHGCHELREEMLRYQRDDAKLVQDCVIAAAGAVYLVEQGGVLLYV